MKKTKRQVFQSPSDEGWQALEDAYHDAMHSVRRPEDRKALDSFDIYCLSRMRQAYKGRLVALVKHPNAERQSRIEQGMTLVLQQFSSERHRIEIANYFLDRNFEDVLGLRRRGH